MGDMADTNHSGTDAVVHAAVPDQVEYMLTTVDNPFDPFEQFDEWYAYDTQQGYHTAAFLARITMLSDDLSDADQHVAIQVAIDEIVEVNVLGLYRKVSRN